MFKRFTERARRVIILAREEAELYRHEYLGTEHILQGVIKGRRWYCYCDHSKNRYGSRAT